MTRFVVDASVVVKWLVEEEYTERALRLNTPGNVLLAPDFFLIEVSNTLWKKWRRGEITSDEVRRAYSLVATAPIGALDPELLVEPALDLAMAYGVTVYDALYVAAALREQCPLVTADRKLHDALLPAFPANVTWVGSL